MVQSFLTGLRKRLFASRPKQGDIVYPLGLNRDQITSIQHLAGTPQWQSFENAIQAVCENEFKVLLSGLPHDQYLAKCGRITALMDILTLPDTLEQKAKDLDEHQRSASEPAPGKRDLTFFGSSYFSPSRKPPVHEPTG